MKHDNRYVWLDLVRGISALAVCAGHLRAATLSDYAELNAPTLLHKVFYFLTGLGHEAVMVFFVLSGLFVGGSILKSREKFRPSTYAIARLTRLWIVLIPALAVTFAVDRVVASYMPEVLRGGYYALWNSGPASPEGYSTSLSTLLGNIFFLQTIYAPVFGTNGPLWSLANEFWYYAVFPLLAFAAGQCGNPLRIWSRASGGIIAVLLWLWLPSEIRSGFLVWLMGVAVYLAATRLTLKWRPLALVFALLLFAGSLAYSKSMTWQIAVGLRSDYAVGIGFSALCVILAAWPAPNRARLSLALTKLAGATSEFSYSLYLSHFPFVILIATLSYGGRKVAPNVDGLLHLLEWFACLLMLGGLFWFLFERQTVFIKRFISSRVLSRWT